MMPIYFEDKKGFSVPFHTPGCYSRREIGVQNVGHFKKIRKIRNLVYKIITIVNYPFIFSKFL